jgi:hypothetical protein
MTDAVHSEVETQRTFADDDAGGFLDRCGVAAANPPSEPTARGSPVTDPGAR